MDLALLPTLELVTNPTGIPAIPAGDYLLFTYRRTDLSVAAGITAECQTTTDLTQAWLPASSLPGAIQQEDDNFAFTPLSLNTADRVRVYIPLGEAPARLGRLRVLVP
jgi:hypothetical protein